MNLYQDVTEIVDVTTDADVILVLDSAVITAAYGLFYFSSSVEDAVVILSVAMDVAAMTAVCGLSFFSSSVEDAAVTHGVEMAAATTIAAVNQTNFKDGKFRPFFNLHSFSFYRIVQAHTSYIFTTTQTECLWNKFPQNS